MSDPDIVPEAAMPHSGTAPDAPGPDHPACEFTTPAVLHAYLHRHMDPAAMDAMRRHLDGCERCWHRWNRHRWDAAAHHPLYTELADFLGPRLRPYLDSSKALAAEWDAADPQTDTEIAEFFRSSLSYLINLVIWEASGNRPPYVATALPTLTQYGIRTVLDVGCGIGSDAIALRRNGFTVTGCDYRSPSTQFVHHRTNGTITVVEPIALPTAPGTDALWIIDTLDHIPDVGRSLGRLLAHARLVVTEDLTHTHQHGRQRFHHRRPYSELAGLLASYGLTSLGNDGVCQYWARTKARGSHPTPNSRPPP
ncbi:methyltransferase domain-containing protein [Nocardia sp. NPDC050435]|uniref:methyltransferase domain-containing protein n=1 Tax=Nocardia sp. NPDC050435 TaxID=3155040 RepID=UPI0033C1CE1B